MRTALSKTIPFKPPGNRALTILEMLVSTALLSLIVLGLTAMLIQTQKAFKSALKQSNVSDAGRTVLDMIAADLSQLSDPHFTNVTFPANGNGAPPSLEWSYVFNQDLMQYQQSGPNGTYVAFRTNSLQDIFIMVLTNNVWTAIGYSVSNWFTNGSGTTYPGIGTLYRYVVTTNAPLATNNYLFHNFLYQTQTGLFTNSMFHRVADGVVSLTIHTFDAGGNEMCWEPYYDATGNDPLGNILPVPRMEYPVIETNTANVVMTNYLPHSVDIELGILEPDAFEHARALYTAGANTAALSNLQYQASAQTQVYRQHIIIPSAP